jgi:hypothetical protein
MIVPAKNMSCAISDLSSNGPTVGKLSTERHDDAAGDDVREQITDRADERVQRHAHRIAHDDLVLGEAPRPRGHHVRLPQFVQQVGAHDADQLRGSLRRPAR